MISGVCVGLSEFLHIDVTLIRVLFVVFALVTSGWGILAYVVLMFVVPKVDTRAQAAGGAATGAGGPTHWPWDNHGWPWDHEGWPWDKYGWPWDHPTPEQQQAREASPEWQKKQASRDARVESREQRRVWREQRLADRQTARDARQAARDARRAAGMHHPGGSVFGTMMMIFFLMFGFFWLSFWTRGHFFFGWPFFWGFPHWIGIIVFFLILRLIFMPFRMARWYGYGYGPYAHPHYAWAAMWNGLAWFMAMIFVVWLMYHYIPEFHNMIHDFQTTWRDDISL